MTLGKLLTVAAVLGGLGSLALAAGAGWCW
jgi:hypothetical protein